MIAEVYMELCGAGERGDSGSLLREVAGSCGRAAASSNLETPEIWGLNAKTRWDEPAGLERIVPVKVP